MTQQNWKQRFPKLRKRIVRRLAHQKGRSINDHTFDDSVRRLANTEGITPAEALFRIAGQLNLGYQADFRRLSPSERSHIKQIVSNPQSTQSRERYVVRLGPRQQLAKVWQETVLGKVAIGVTTSVLAAIVLAGLAVIAKFLIHWISTIV